MEHIQLVVCDIGNTLIAKYRDLSEQAKRSQNGILKRLFKKQDAASHR